MLNPNQFLSLPSTALVMVRATVMPLVSKGEHFDVQIRLPNGSEATSLKGGWLMEMYLSEQAIVPGRGLLKGHVYAKAEGPVLISTGIGDKASLAGLLRRGRVLGGAVSMKDRDMALLLRNDYQSVRTSGIVARRIGHRFYEYNGSGIRKSLAEGVTDKKIRLKLHSKYKDNFPRYLQVIRNIAYRETERAQYVRMQKLKQRLHSPETSERAALKLEAIGKPAIPILKSGLKNPKIEVQFHSAVALAYIGKSDGLDVLAKAAREEPAFRVFAFAAMAVVDDARSHLLLRDLMNEKSSEVRYGAFRAATSLDSQDISVRGENINNEFLFHVLETDGEPMIHLTSSRKAELVLFGADQRFRLPMTVRAGNHILVTAAPGSKSITVSRYEVGRDRRETVSANVSDVVHKVVELGASYPDIVHMLLQANRQHNIPGRLELDALPQSGRVYYRPSDDSAIALKSKTRVGNSRLIPNLFASEKSTLGLDTHKDAAKPEDNGTTSSRDESGDSEQKNDNKTARITQKPISTADTVAEEEDNNNDQKETDGAEPIEENESKDWFGFFRFVGKQSEPELE